MQTIAQAVADLEAGRTTARKLVERCLEAIEKPDGEGSKTFLRVYAEQARASADAMDALRKVNRAPGQLAGIPISLKDLFDVAGEVTAAGSTVLAEAKPAAAHATVVQPGAGGRADPDGPHQHDGVRLLRHRRQPAFRHAAQPVAARRGPHSRAAAVRGRRCRSRTGWRSPGWGPIPAAPAGSRRRSAASSATSRPRGGCRSPACCRWQPSLDSVGPLANSVACCAAIDAVLAGEALPQVNKLELRGLRLAVPGNVVMDGVEPEVAEAFGRGLNRLGNLGVRITHLSFPQFERGARGQ